MFYSLVPSRILCQSVILIDFVGRQRGQYPLVRPVLGVFPYEARVTALFADLVRLVLEPGGEGLCVGVPLPFHAVAVGINPVDAHATQRFLEVAGHQTAVHVVEPALELESQFTSPLAHNFLYQIVLVGSKRQTGICRLNLWQTYTCPDDVQLLKSLGQLSRLG